MSNKNEMPAISLAHKLADVEGEPKTNKISRETWTIIKIGSAAILTVLGANVIKEKASEDKQPFGGATTTTEVLNHGDTLWRAARQPADELGKDIRVVIDDIFENSPELADGVDAGDHIVRPATQAEIEKMKNHTNQDQG